MRINPLSRRRTMDEKGIRDLLRDAEVGQLATVGGDGKPYVVPICFVFDGERIYFHCGLTGRKLENIMANPAVGFSVYEVLGQGVLPEKPCDSWTYFRSVVASGTARIVEGEDKVRALRLLAEKFANGPVREMPDEQLKRTCVVAIDIAEIGGKKNEKTNS